MKKMQWRQFSPVNKQGNIFFTVQRSQFTSAEKKMRRQLCPLHTHEYAEIFWVQSGKCYHIINNDTQILEEGNLVFVRPNDTHKFKLYREKPVFMINVVIMPETLEFLQMRYLGPDEKLYHSNTSIPVIYKMSNSQLKWIESASKELAHSKQSLLSIEKFLVDLIYRLSFHENTYATSKMPDWLKDACTKIKEQEHFCQGVRQFVNLSSRCTEHVSREVKKWTGKTATEIVNDARMQYASQELVTTDKKIVNIAYDCGYESVSYFYRVFEKHFGISPRSYRLKNRTI